MQHGYPAIEPLRYIEVWSGVFNVNRNTIFPHLEPPGLAVDGRRRQAGCLKRYFNPRRPFLDIQTRNQFRKGDALVAPSEAGHDSFFGG